MSFYCFHNNELLTTFNVLLVGSFSLVLLTTRQDKPALGTARREGSSYSVEAVLLRLL